MPDRASIGQVSLTVKWRGIEFAGTWYFQRAVRAFCSEIEWVRNAVVLVMNLASTTINLDIMLTVNENAEK